MHRKISILVVAGILVCLSGGAVHAGSFRFPVGLAYVSGFNDIKNRYEDNFKAEGYVITKSSEGIPIGLMFQPYFQFDSGFGIGAGLGPVMAIMGDHTFFDLPIAVDARYFFLPDANISPYIRGGVKKHIASGDYVNSSSIGVFGGLGVELFRKKRVGLGIEALYDISSIEFEKKTSFGGGSSKEDIEPSSFLVSLSAIF